MAAGAGEAGTEGTLMDKLMEWVLGVAFLIFGPVFLFAGASTGTWWMTLIGLAVLAGFLAKQMRWI